jgi:hypothetical protein
VPPSPGFDFDKVARFDEADVERLVQDKGIIRHRGKIVSTINNAKRALEMRDEFGSLAAYFWAHEPGPDERPETVDYATLTAQSDHRRVHRESPRISRSAAGASSDRQRSMPSCRPWVWSTIILKAAAAVRMSRGCATLWCARRDA